MPEGSSMGRRGYTAAVLLPVLALGLFSTLQLPALRAQTLAVPQISDISPRSVAPGSGDFVLTVRGAHIQPGITGVAWNGEELAGATCTAAAAPEIASCTVTVPAEKVAAPDTAAITLVNPGGVVGSLASPPAYLTVTAGMAPWEGMRGLDVITPHHAVALAMVTADVNRDGHQDVVANNSDGTSTVFLGDGTGHLTAGQTFSSPPPGIFQQAFLALDVDADGNVDIVGACSGIQVFPGNGDGTFRPAVSSEATGCGPVAAGDFDSDGRVDIVVTDEVPNFDRQHILHLYVGDGTGQFMLRDTLIRRPMAVTQSLVAGDFDSNGRLDLLRASGGDGGADAGTLSLITFDAAGLMTERWTQPTAPQPKLAVGDFNNDGRLDALVSSGIASQAALYVGDGSGAFAPSSPFPIDLAAVGLAWATDFDGDGLTDVVLAGCAGSRCGYYDFLRGDGMGGFWVDTLNPSHEDAAAIADMNHDGRIDLVGRRGQTSVSVIPQYGRLNPLQGLNFGSGRYQTPKTEPLTVTAAGSAPVHIHSITLTDGYTLGSGSTCSTDRPVVPGIPCTLDVVFTATHPGQHDGTLTVVADADMVETTFTANLFARSDTFGFINLTSVDFGGQWVGSSTPFANAFVNRGDSAITISGMVTSGPFTVDGSACPALLLPGTSCPIELQFVPTTSGPMSGSLTVTGNDRPYFAALQGLGLSGAAGLSPTSLTFAPRGIHTDGAAQTVTVTNTDPYPLNNLALGFGGTDPQEFAIVGGTCVGTSTLAPSASCTIDVAFRALSVGAKTATLIVDGSGTDQTAALSGAGLGNGIPYIQQLRPASLTRGGGDTVLTVNGASFAAGAALLFNGAPLPTTVVSGGELRATVPAASLAAATTAAIAVRNPVPGGEVSNTAWLPITTVATPAFTRTDLTLPVAPETMATGDFNGDGIVDVAVADCHDGNGFPPSDCAPGAVTIMLGSGAGPYSTATRIPLPYEASAYGLVAGDFNSDGRLDLLVTHGGDYDQHMLTLIGDGAGGFTAMPLGLASICAAGRMTTADITRDGNLDLFQGDFYCSGAVGFTGNGLGGFRTDAAFVYFWDASGYHAPTLADFDGDGLLDLARSFRAVKVVRGTGSEAWGVTDDAVIPDSFAVATAAGDLNGDGRPDLVTMVVDNPGAATSRLAILMNDGSGFHGDGTSAFAVSQQLPLTGRDIWWNDRFRLIVPVLADVNGDGTLDIVVIDGANVRLLINDGTGQVTQSGEPIPIGDSPRDLAVVDVNGDGRLDIVISNGGDRAVTMLMQASPSASPAVTFSGAPATARYGAAFAVTATTNADVMPTITAAGACRVSGVTGTPASSRATVTMTSGEGSCALEAAWPETAEYAAASATQTTAALKHATLTVLTPGILNPSTPGQPVLFAFGVIGLALPLPSGTVTVTASTGESCTGTVSILLIGACTVTFDTPGARTVRATYGGDQFFEPSTSAAVSQTVAGPVLRLTPASFDFGSMKSGSTKQKVFTLANTSAVAARITSVAIGAPGTGASSYRVSSSCGATLAANRSCDITVTFAPTSTGAKTATLIVTDDAAGSPHTASLTGSGK